MEETVETLTEGVVDKFGAENAVVLDGLAERKVEVLSAPPKGPQLDLVEATAADNFVPLSLPRNPSGEATL
jgi:hypothetical protein